MQYNNSLWHNYTDGYVGKLFVPYQRKPMMVDNGNGELHKLYVNSWSENGCKDGLFDETLVRKGWSLNFMRQHADFPCPVGWKAGLDGWCIKQEPENEPVFYTDKAFIPKNQYWNGYGHPNVEPKRISESFDMRSINPLNGNYYVFFQPKENYGPNKTVYQRNATADSYLAF